MLLLWWTLAFLPSGLCDKLPSWRGPDTFFEGPLPSGRYGHGFASSDDGKIYIFAGCDYRDGAIFAMIRLS